ncbi:MAG TPA: hypothetical protein VMW16_15455 [Sedimentisphaerales bacterium]|nr:hypothetical protein [Sedimentisphaerales bacterium]
MANNSIRKLLDIAAGWRPQAKSDFDSLSIVARRFLQAFEGHGLKVSQIPRLLPQIKLEDPQSQTKLLAALTPEILDKTAQLFGIRVQWLEGVDDEIYDYQAVYKRPATLLEHLAKIRRDGNEGQGLEFPLRVLTTVKQLDRNDQRQQLLAPVLVERFADLGDLSICRYHVYRDGFDWSYPPARIELKAIAHVIYSTLHVPIPLFVVSEKDMEDILEGRTIPRRFLEGCQITSPSLEDYALTLEESQVAREVDELPEVLTYIDTHHLMDISLEGAPPPDPEPEVVPIEAATPATPAGAPKPPNKPGKLQARDDAWAEVMGYAKGHWAEDPSISIAEMIRRIKKIKTMKASMLTESAIHKRIAKVAPVGIRGKRGRKANKST